MSSSLCVHQVVAATRLPHALDMDALTGAYSYANGSPRTDVFPGYTLKRYKLCDGDGEWLDLPPAKRVIDKRRGDIAVSFIVFAGGNVNVTGMSSEDDIAEVEAEINRIVEPFYL